MDSLLRREKSTIAEIDASGDGSDLEGGYTVDRVERGSRRSIRRASEHCWRVFTQCDSRTRCNTHCIDGGVAARDGRVIHRELAAVERRSDCVGCQICEDGRSDAVGERLDGDGMGSDGPSSPPRRRELPRSDGSVAIDAGIRCQLDSAEVEMCSQGRPWSVVAGPSEGES